MRSRAAATAAELLLEALCVANSADLVERFLKKLLCRNKPSDFTVQKDVVNRFAHFCFFLSQLWDMTRENKCNRFHDSLHSPLPHRDILISVTMAGELGNRGGLRLKIWYEKSSTFSNGSVHLQVIGERFVTDTRKAFVSKLTGTIRSVEVD